MDDLPLNLRDALDTYRKDASSESWTALSQLPVGDTDVLDALQVFKPDFPDPLPLPVEDLVEDNNSFYQWPELPNPDDVRNAIIAALRKA